MKRKPAASVCDMKCFTCRHSDCINNGDATPEEARAIQQVLDQPEKKASTHRQ